MKKILYCAVTLCIATVAMCVVYQLNATETTFEVAASDLEATHCWVFRGYSEAIYKGESYTGETNFLNYHSGEPESVTLRKKGFFNSIVSVKYKIRRN